MSRPPEADRRLPTGLYSGLPAGAAAEAPNDDGTRGLVKSPLDLGSGLFLLGLGVLGFAGGFNLPAGTLSGIGSGLLPKTVAILVAGFGVTLILLAFLFEGDRLERWHLRGPVFVLGAVCLFAMVVRGSELTLGGILGIPVLVTIKVPGLGLLVAGPLSVIVSSLAEKTTRLLEIVIFAIVMTLLSGILFKELLGLPIPFDPFGLVPEPVNLAYEGAKSAIAHGFWVVKSLFVR
jgi:putative tricarboxylic transport membrane protein